MNKRNLIVIGVISLAVVFTLKVNLIKSNDKSGISLNGLKGFSQADAEGGDGNSGCSACYPDANSCCYSNGNWWVGYRCVK